MAKLPPSEHFRVSCECEISDLGLTVAGLTKLGMTNLKFELVTTTPTFAQKTHHEVKAEDFLMEWMKEHPTFKVIEAVEHFRANGRTDGACYTAVKMACERKTLKKLGPGNYARTDVKAIAAPKDKPIEKTKPEITNGDFILRLARRAHGRVSIAKIKQAFAEDGRVVASVHPTISGLVKKNRIKRNGDGMFEVNVPANHVNGAAPVEGMVTHG